MTRTPGKWEVVQDDTPAELCDLDGGSVSYATIRSRDKAAYEQWGLVGVSWRHHRARGV